MTVGHLFQVGPILASRNRDWTPWTSTSSLKVNSMVYGGYIWIYHIYSCCSDIKSLIAGGLHLVPFSSKKQVTWVGKSPQLTLK